MIIESKAIVINSFKYGEFGLITRCFTLKNGLQSFLLKGILKSKKGGVRKSQFEPLTQLKLIYNFKNNGNLQFIKEAKAYNIYKSIPNKISKKTLVIFLSDILKNILKDNGKKITGLLTVVELIELGGRSKFDFPVESWLKC